MTDVIVGIDLGTTNSEVAALLDGKVRVIASEGEEILPSFVGLSPTGALLVGTPARNQFTAFPERTIKSIKRRMGSSEKVRLGDREYTPAEISAFILKALKTRAEAALKTAVSRAVITVPAFFSDAQRQATRDAGAIAGLEVVRIVNEPTAAALAYGEDRQGDRTVLVYDLGGGTFDVSIVQQSGDVTEVLASHGNTLLGGDDFDQLLVEALHGRFLSEGGPDLREDRRAMGRLLRAAEEAKKQLSFEPYVKVREEHLAEKNGVPMHLDTEVSREEYEALISHLVERTFDSVHKALLDAGKKPADLAEILLVGGATRTPMIGELLEGRTGLRPRQDVHPDLCVALGAGVLASRLAGHDVNRVLVDVSPYSFGPEHLGTLNGIPSPHCYSPVLSRNTPLPASRTKIYGTVHDAQDAVDVTIYQGEDPDARKNVPVGRFTIKGLAPVEAPNEILCRMELDIDGILRVTAIEKRTGLSKTVTIERATRAMTAADIADARARLLKTMGDEVEPATPSNASPEIGLVDEAETAREGGDTDRAGRVAIAEADALLERSRRLLPRMAPEDREEAIELNQSLESAKRAGDQAALKSVSEELADLLFFVEEK